jgi:hypothetical protein
VESETGGETERRSDELEGIDGRELGDKGLEKVFELGADWQATSRGGLFEVEINAIRKQNLQHTLTPPPSSTETESIYPKSSGLSWLSFS